ncbi:hydantoinase/oxoprolinase family protein [Dechloromonas denitrificans]|uniref:hydantoinase/oxoprolinase family protein n=1 Tax=Dechloromonas denitrificans TaxID=281362 RepID=UPI001CF959F7|nr:hydantoinase/oxoprolinase family protein [Dechloromonas denitrificans]UCV07039.1 hydantoinase/oxoprolinase family protein [Dechloromonas denitrificans]
MGFTVDIDTGGTFTDGFITRGDQFRTVKTPTTPHDLTVCFMECIKESAKAFAVPLGDFLYDTDIIRFSNTIGTNSIIQRDGPKIGLIVTAGFEGLCPTHAGDGKRPVVEASMVAAINEETSEAGVVHRVPERDQVLAAAQSLIDRGARCLVIALNHADVNSENERVVRESIKREYPRDYLGSVPVFLSSDIVQRPGYQERINTASLNAYIHGKLTRLLYKAGEDLRRQQYRGHLFIGHNNGAVARVAKTRAINTYNSGPAAGLLGAKEIGALYGARCVMSGDMGGTSFDIGFVVDGEPSYALRPDVEGFGCNLPMLAIRALGAGGGSIAEVVSGVLRVGPQSAGALPGPACFGLGGKRATVTDANLVLGWLDPDYFLGGSKKLDREKASAAIEQDVAKPLGISVEEAAWLIKETVEADVGRELSDLRKDMGPHPDPLLVVYGGAGPLHSCAIAQASGISTLVVTPFSAVFSAYSSSLMDVGHLYYRRLDLPLHSHADLSLVDKAVGELRQRAEADMRGEGFSAASITWELELIVRSAAGSEAKIAAPVDFHHSPEGLQAVREKATALLGPAGDLPLTLCTLGLFGKAPVAHYLPREVPAAEAPVHAARRGQRQVSLHRQGPAIALDVYDRDLLGNGHQVSGPVIVESRQTTMVIPQGWSLKVDRYDNALIERMH